MYLGSPRADVCAAGAWEDHPTLEIGHIQILGVNSETRWMFPKNRGGFPPKSSGSKKGFSIINHPFWGFPPYFWKHQDLEGLRIFFQPTEMIYTDVL